MIRLSMSNAGTVLCQVCILPRVVYVFGKFGWYLYLVVLGIIRQDQNIN